MSDEHTVGPVIRAMMEARRDGIPVVPEVFNVHSVTYSFLCPADDAHAPLFEWLYENRWACVILQSPGYQPHILTAQQAYDAYLDAGNPPPSGYTRYLEPIVLPGDPDDVEAGP